MSQEDVNFVFATARLPHNYIVNKCFLFQHLKIIPCYTKSEMASLQLSLVGFLMTWLLSGRHSIFLAMQFFIHALQIHVSCVAESI